MHTLIPGKTALSHSRAHSSAFGATIYTITVYGGFTNIKNVRVLLDQTTSLLSATPEGSRVILHCCSLATDIQRYSASKTGGSIYPSWLIASPSQEIITIPFHSHLSLCPWAHFVAVNPAVLKTYKANSLSCILLALKTLRDPYGNQKCDIDIL